MIDRLDLADEATARQVLAVQRAAYRYEADLIGFDGIPPLHEDLAALRRADLQWMGILAGGRLVAAMAITGEGRACDIDRLVVHPDHHRRGFGRRLVEAVLHHRSVTVSAVETNLPAVALYESLGFRRVGRREIGLNVWSVMLEHDAGHLATSFDVDVAGYESARPGYPAAMFDLLASRCGLGPGANVLEIGPGTGQATLPMLDRGATVTAVEAGSAMAARLRERTAGRPCTVVHASFELAAPILLPAPFDLAVAATSFHWVDPVIGIERLARLLEPGRWLALWWTVFRDADHDNPDFVEGVNAIARRFQTAERQATTPHPLEVEVRRAEIADTGWFDLVDVIDFEWPWAHDAASVRALFASFSDWSTLPEPDRERALDDVAAIVAARDGGTITRRYITKLYLARRTTRITP